MNILLLILQLLPSLLQTIVAIETTAPVPQVGPAKAALLSEILATSMSTGVFNKHVISQDQLLSIIQAITIAIVSFYNLIGIFKKTPTATVPPVTSTPAA